MCDNVTFWPSSKYMWIQSKTQSASTLKPLKPEGNYKHVLFQCSALLGNLHSGIHVDLSTPTYCCPTPKQDNVPLQTPSIVPECPRNVTKSSNSSEPGQSSIQGRCWKNGWNGPATPQQPKKPQPVFLSQVREHHSHPLSWSSHCSNSFVFLMFYYLPLSSIVSGNIWVWIQRKPCHSVVCFLIGIVTLNFSFLPV